MPLYMLQAAYTPEAWNTLCRNPEDRSRAVAGQLEKLGGRLVGFWYCFGDYDTVTVFQAPDEATAAAFSLSVAAPGFLKNTHTTVLLSSEEALQAMKKAGSAPYRGPGRT